MEGKQLPQLFIDTHTHSRERHSADVCRIRSVFAREYAADSSSVDGSCSVGLHPWHVAAGTWEEDTERVRHAASDLRVVAVGEAGLDKYADASLDVQRAAFEAQINIACDAGLPMIVHLVKAFDLFLELVRAASENVIFIVHGFRGSPEMVGQLVRAGAYISFGAALLEPPAKLRRALCAVPDNRLFLETDESGCDIREIYEAAAGMRGVELRRLVRIIENNVVNIFGRLAPGWAW